jgi:DNA-binding XRE family transcriptional regulator
VYSASTAKASAPASPGFVAGATEVVVDIQNSDSGYNNKIYWSADNWNTRNYLGVGNQTASISLGKFKSGTKIEFGIDNGNGDFFKTGSAGLNSDGFQHARVQSDSAGMQIGFEDLRGGGDQDFNDAIVSVRNLPEKPQSPVVQNPAPVVKTPETPGSTGNKPPAKDNRSGLGDGTNPGHGDGRVNSPNNAGTDNPNKAGSAKSKLKVSDLIAALVQRWLKEPGFKEGYDALGLEFAVASMLIEARTRAKLSQAQLAKKMGTSQSTIARLESGSAKPSFSTLERFAEATGMRVRVVFEPVKSAKRRRSKRAA